MKRNLLLIAFVLVTMCLNAQPQPTVLNFTAKQQNGAYQKLDSVQITNLTKNWTEVLIAPDTILALNMVGIADYEAANGGEVLLSQNVPNPFNGVTNFKLTLANQEKVELLMFDMNGRKVAEYQNTLPEGEHVFRAEMNTPQTYLLSAVSKKGNVSIKMVNMSAAGDKCRIELVGSQMISGGIKKYSSNLFDAGDNMQYVAFATQHDGSKNVTITQEQMEGETIVFTFPNEYFAPEIAVSTDSAMCAETTATLFGSYAVNHTGVAAAGFAYKMSEDADYTLVECKNADSPFSVDLSALKNGAAYVYKAFVRTTEDSVVYGEEKIFTTIKIKVELKVNTIAVGDIHNTTATVTGKMMSWENVTAYGTRIFSIETGFDTLCLSINLKDSMFTTLVTGLKAKSNYYAQAYAKDEEGEAYGDLLAFTTLEEFDCGGTMTDYEGNEYLTTKIGSQCWMAEDLRSQYYADGKGIAGFTEYEDECVGYIVYYEWPSATRCFNDAQTDITVGVQGACPDGWHIPSYTDFNTMFKTIDPDWQDVKEASSTLYRSNNRLAVKLAKPACWVGEPTRDTPSYYTVDLTDFNASGFTARPTGYYGANLVCPGTAHYWTSCGSPMAKSDVLKIAATNSGIQFQKSNSQDRYCVRCVKDE